MSHHIKGAIMNDRRRYLIHASQLAAMGSMAGWLGCTARAAEPQRVTMAVTGPGNLLFLPLPLLVKIGADRAEGFELDIRYIGGAPQAFSNMLERNSDFAAGGLPALALQRISGKPLVCIAPISRVPAFTLLVRSGLQGKVRKIADLAGRVVGVKGYVPEGRATTQLFVEHALRRAGVPPDRVNYVQISVAYENQYAALVTGSVDALMGDEPFASRLIKEKAAFALADYHDLADTRKLLGGLFLNGCVATRQDMIDSRPDLVEKVVKAVTRTLTWIATHDAAEIVTALAYTDNLARVALLDALKRHKAIYSPDGRFSDEQIASTERFVHATEKTPAAQAFRMKSLINARWAGTTA